ncbi:MAG: 2-succinyl-5-enolpyruvyl-6-hydroxy-3-cyclohexene-1-carboxylic-acid synthase [Ilumatobacteraceae bacterium]
MTSSPTVTATFCATLVDEWIRLGVRHAVVAPGSRSTPLALAVGARNDLEVHVFHDERSASYAALGIAIESGVPAILLSTSGTAAVQFHAAAVEAHHAEVPMLICTADRPPELQGVGAPQTIDQRNLYGVASRTFVDAGIADDKDFETWRDLAQNCLESACGESPGPVQINFPFREPLIGEIGELPDAKGRMPLKRSVNPTPSRSDIEEVANMLRGKRGVIIAGAGCDSSGSVAQLSRTLGWPLLADPRSGCRITETDSPVVVAAADTFLRSKATAKLLYPDVILRLGQPPVSKVVNSWLQESGAQYIAISATPQLIDPDRVVSRHVLGSISEWCSGLVDYFAEKRERQEGNVEWLSSWQRTELVTQQSITDSLASEKDATEPAVARELSRRIPSGSRLVVSSSMPVRDIEWFAEPRDGLQVYVNRGASGIDGVVSTAIGVALASRVPTYLLIGDIAMLHDSNGLIGLAKRSADVRIVCIDNRGGGIFSFLPQATSLNVDRFEQLFGTPHDSNIELIARAHGVTGLSIDSIDALISQIDQPGPWVACIATNRTENVAMHDRLIATTAEALARES